MPLASGFEETEAVAVIDVLRRAKIEVVTAAIEDRIVESARKIKIVADVILSDIDASQFDGIVLPGGEPGTTNLEANNSLKTIITLYAGQDKLIAAICAAPRILNGLGILTGKRATSFPETRSLMAGSLYSEDPVVRDGRYITSRGVGTALQFGIAIVDYYLGEEEATRLAAKMLI